MEMKGEGRRTCSAYRGEGGHPHPPPHPSKYGLGIAAHTWGQVREVELVDFRVVVEVPV